MASNQESQGEARKRKTRLFDRYVYRSVSNQAARAGLPRHQVFGHYKMADAALQDWLGPHYKRRVEDAIRRAKRRGVKLSATRAGRALVLTIQSTIPAERPRRERSISDPSLMGLDAIDPSPSPDRVAEEKEDRSRLMSSVKQALNRLTRRERRVFENCYYQGMSSQEVATALKMTVKAVERSRDRARAKIRASLLRERQRRDEAD